MNELVDILALVSDVVRNSGARTLLIGGIAVNHYGYARNTADVDFMVALTEQDAIERLMRDAGFTNIERLENVVFYRRPGWKIRVDILKVEHSTFEELWRQSVAIQGENYAFRLPCLRDLLSMKLFALKHGWERRIHKDMPDVAHLVVINQLDLENDLKPLCLQFADESIYNKIQAEIRLLKS